MTGLLPEPVPTTADPERVERLLRRFFDLCEDPRTRRRAVALVRASSRNAGSGRRLYALINRVVLHPAGRTLGVEGSAVRMELVAAQLLGVATMRYVLELEPVASMSVDDLVARLAPAVRALLESEDRPDLQLPRLNLPASPEPGQAQVDHLSALVRILPY